jgi:hypothetical protein
MLLRNLNQSDGLCNDTRLLVTQLLKRILEAKIISETRVEDKVFIPQIVISHSDSQLLFVLKRRQLSIYVCFALTMNKRYGIYCNVYAFLYLNLSSVMVNCMSLPLDLQVEMDIEYSLQINIMVIISIQKIKNKYIRKSSTIYIDVTFSINFKYFKEYIAILTL